MTLAYRAFLASSAAFWILSAVWWASCSCLFVTVKGTGPQLGADVTAHATEEVEGVVGVVARVVATGLAARAAEVAAVAATLIPASRASLDRLSVVNSMPAALHLAIRQAMQALEVGEISQELAPPRHLRSTLAQLFLKNALQLSQTSAPKLIVEVGLRT